MERVRRERELETQPRSAPAPPAPVPAQQILMLQQGAGNAAVARVLAREPAPGAPDLDAPAQTMSAGDLTDLLAHLRSHLAEAEQESEKNEIEQRKAERADAAGLPEAPAKKPGLLSTLAKPVRKLGAAMKKAGAWLGIGKRKPAAEPTAAAANAAAEEKELGAMIGRLEQAMARESEKLADQLGSMNAAMDAVSDVIDPDEREQIVRRSPA